MALPAHLHLLIPSSTPSIHLEARLYLPLPLDDATRDGTLPISRIVRSVPTRLEDLAPSASSAVRALGIERLITAAHPWAKLGGNMLDPFVSSLPSREVLKRRVIYEHLLAAVLEQPEGAPGKDKTAVLSFNVRGCGRSEGSAPLLTIGNEAEDFAAVEQAGLELCRGANSTVEAWRFVRWFRPPTFALVMPIPEEVDTQAYSWGCTAALSAPPPSTGLRGMFLVSPAVGATKLLGWITINTEAALRRYLDSPPIQSDVGPENRETGRVHMMFGTADQFTGIGTFRKLAMEYRDKGLKGIEVEGGDHFWRSETDGEQLEGAIQDWLTT